MSRGACRVVRVACRCRQVLHSRFSQVSVSEVINTGRFSLEAAQRMPGWLAELNAFEEARAVAAAAGGGGHRHHHHDHGHGSSAAVCGPDCDQPSHVHTVSGGQPSSSSSSSSSALQRSSESVKYGISSFVYHATRPFHPQRLLDVALSRTWPGVLRTKGFFWLATRHDVMGVWQSAGGAWQGEPSARWLAAVPDEELPPDTDRSLWHPAWGDRCQQLVWIGIDMQQDELKAMLDACLLTDGEMALGPEGWAAQLDDPLPEWAVEEEEEEGEEGGESE